MQRLGFLAFEGFPMSCLTLMIEPLRAANEILGETAFEWVLIGETEARINSSANVGFDPDVVLKDIKKLDYLFLLSGPQSRFKCQKTANGILRRIHKHGTCIGSISGGVFPLARSGLLDDVTSSIHWCYCSAFEAEFPMLETIDDVIYKQANRMTISGAAAGFDAMLSLINDKLDAKIMTEVACWFQYPLVRGFGVQQRIPTIHSTSTDDMLPNDIRKAVHLFSENFEDPISITEVAKIICLSPRQMERKFKKYTGLSPIQFYRSKRMNAARQMVLYSSDNISDIAFSVGYSTSTPLVKYYKNEFGMTPEEDRKKINMFRYTKNVSVPSV